MREGPQAGINALIKRGTDQSPFSLHLEKAAVSNPEKQSLARHPISQELDLGLLASRTVRNKRVLLKPLIDGI